MHVTSGEKIGTTVTRTHWRLVPDAEGLLWLHCDRAGSGTNVLDEAVLGELELIVGELAQDPPRGLAILSDKPAGFIAGADIRGFTRVASEAQALALMHRGQGVFERLERLPCPTVAVIHGYCLGGGLELALACRYRIAEDAPSTRIGLPEVRLGIHPGFGGTVRLPRLIGPAAALDVMLSGRALGARAAHRLGIVDRAVPARLLKNAARRLLIDTPAPRRPGLLQRAPGWAPLRPLTAALARRRASARARPDHYPAPCALIELWRRHDRDPAHMLEEEARSVARLITGPTAQNLIRAFFLQERLKGLAPRGEAEVQHVHVIGAGTMGGDIAAWCALQGLRVTLQDRAPALIGPALGRAHALFRKQLEEPRRVQQALDRLIPDTRGSGLGRADLVIEAVFEDAETKRSLFRAIEPRLRDDAWIATNTSSMPLETLTDALARPERLVGLHFFNPVAKMPLVEVVRGAACDAALVRRAIAFVRRIDKLPLPVASAPGFLVNRVLMPYLHEAMLLASEGVAAESVDRAATDFGMPMGPLLLADTVGLDICLAAAEVLGRDRPVEPAARLRELVAAGRLGRKSGEGFYRHRGERPEVPRTREPPAPEIADRLVLRMVNEALACVREGVVADADLADAGVLFGAGFPPFRGGPLHYLEASGRTALRARLHALERAHGARFAPDPAWNDAPLRETGT
jgi:3-hydroxyacyl-CoA dehydrogenase / enoyl-CoA hydratase / 3-hydroxybutyryl-CoA epimerase